MNKIYSRSNFLKKSGLFLLSTQFIFDQGCKDGKEMENIIILQSLNEALKELDKIEKSSGLTIRSGWNPGKVFHHCSQSIEYSLSGYPENNNVLIRMTIGKVVLSKFLSQGYMSHNLTDPIPGAPTLTEDENIQSGLSRLRKAITDFQKFTGTTAPHFVYDSVSKSDYDKIHAMHIANHLNVFQFS